MDFSSVEPLTLALALLAGFAGMLIHWVKKWTRQETDASLVDFLLKGSTKHKVSAVMAMVAAVVTAVTQTGITPFDVNGLVSILLTGYVADSAANKHQAKGSIEFNRAVEIEVAKRLMNAVDKGE